MGGHGFQRPGSLRLFALDVGAAIRRRGVGTALVKAVEAIASRRALDEVNLEVAIGNRDAIRLYERLGYRRHGDPVSDRWERRLDDGSSQMVDVPSWVMINRLEQVQAATISHRATRSVPYLDRHGLTAGDARLSSQSEVAGRRSLVPEHLPSHAQWRPETTRGYNGRARRAGKCRNW